MPSGRKPGAGPSAWEAKVTRPLGSILMMSVHGYVAAEPELGLPDTGGQVVFVLELAKRFTELGFRVDLVTRRFDDQPEEDRIDTGLRVWRIPFGGPGFIRKEDMHDHLDEFDRRVLDEIADRGLGYDVVSSHYWDAGWSGQRLAEELRIPHVHTPHSLGAWKQASMAGEDPEDAYRFAERIQKETTVFGRCDHLIATSREQVDQLRTDYQVSEDHVTMIPPGIDERRYTPASEPELERIRHRLGFRSEDVYAVGRAAHNKGYDLLIRALPTLEELVPGARLQLAVGANSDRDRRKVGDLQGLAGDLGVGDRVKWLGYIEDEAMADHYRAAGAFALSSRYEPFGMTAAESMACGTPVVVTTHGGLMEQVEFGEHALFADPQRPVEFAVMLGMPLRYPRLRERLSVRGSRFARREFGWGGIARRTLEVFERLHTEYTTRRTEPGPGG
jgi:mannosylfructose-phosphate synthase